MSDFVTLTCPSCGGKLLITDDIERFACANCGNEHLVRRSGGTISLVPLTLELRKVQAGVDRTASELAIKRLREETRDLEITIDRLLDKIYAVYPKDYLDDEKDTDKMIVLLERDIVQMQKSSTSVFGILSGTSAKSNVVGKLTNELRNLQASLKDKKSQLLKHERIVSE